MVYERLLVPVDRNETTVRAVGWGVDLGERLAVPVDLLHVVEDESSRLSLSRGAASSTPAPEAAFPDGIERALGDAVDQVSRHVVSGVPHEEILRFSAEAGTDLVVMGQDGKIGVNNRLFDSVTDKVIQGATVPVLAIPDVDATCRVEDLLLPISGRMRSDGAIDHVAAVAAEFGTTIHVVNVVDLRREAGPFDAGGVTQAFIERKKRDARPAVDRTIDRLVNHGVESSFESAVVHGSPHEALDEYITAHGIDIVVAGQYGRSRVARRILGEVTEHVLQTVSVPVLVVSDA